jgi:hypothetical protein
MTNSSARALYWTPRILSIAFIGFLSLFALDVFDEASGFWNTALALAMHLIPSLVLIGVLVLAWKWEWIGAALYGAAGVLLSVSVFIRPISNHARFLAMLVLSGPALLIAALFLANWLKRGELHPRAWPHIRLG